MVTHNCPYAELLSCAPRFLTKLAGLVLAWLALVALLAWLAWLAWLARLACLAWLAWLARLAGFAWLAWLARLALRAGMNEATSGAETLRMPVLLDGKNQKSSRKCHAELPSLFIFNA